MLNIAQFYFSYGKTTVVTVHRFKMYDNSMLE